MICLGLVGVEPGEPGQGDVEAVGGPGVPDDHGGPAGPGVALGQQVTDDGGVAGQGRGVDGIQGDAAFHVPELPNVILSIADCGPPQEWIAHRL